MSVRSVPDLVPSIGCDALSNTQPFTRELGERIHVFAQNGMVPASRSNTDSEHAFCALLERLAGLWDGGVPALDARLVAVVEFATALRSLLQGGRVVARA